MAMASISACLIVKDEEAFLAGCLDTLTGQVDEIVVVDTGSADSTPQIAKRHGARVLTFGWNGDFSAARNYGLESCSSDWIFYIDADERLSTMTGGQLRDWLRPGWIAANVHFRPRPRHTPYLLTRLFRRHPAIRFEGRIHETVMPSINALVAQGSWEIGEASVAMEHLGYEGNQSHKHHRNLPLLLDCVKSHPERVYYWYHLAETCAALGQMEDARKAARSGIAAAKANPSEKSRADAAMLYHLLARSDLAEGKDPVLLLEEGLLQTTDNFALLLLLAQRNLAAGEPSGALKLAERLLGVDAAALRPGLLSYNEDIFGRFALEVKFSALLRLGRPVEAAQVAAVLAGCGPG